MIDEDDINLILDWVCGSYEGYLPHVLMMALEVIYDREIQREVIDRKTTLESWFYQYFHALWRRGGPPLVRHKLRSRSATAFNPQAIVAPGITGEVL